MLTGMQSSLVPAVEDFDLPKVAIFDLDGTLLDSVDLHASAWQEDKPDVPRYIPDRSR